VSPVKLGKYWPRSHECNFKARSLLFAQCCKSAVHTKVGQCKISPGFRPKVEAIVQTLGISRKSNQILQLEWDTNYDLSLGSQAARFALLVSGPTRRIRSICSHICIFNSIPICLLHWQVNINDYLLHSN